MDLIKTGDKCPADINFTSYISTDENTSKSNMLNVQLCTDL